MHRKPFVVRWRLTDYHSQAADCRLRYSAGVAHSQDLGHSNASWQRLSLLSHLDSTAGCCTHRSSHAQSGTDYLMLHLNSSYIFRPRAQSHYPRCRNLLEFRRSYLFLVSRTCCHGTTWFVSLSFYYPAVLHLLHCQADSCDQVSCLKRDI